MAVPGASEIPAEASGASFMGPGASICLFSFVSGSAPGSLFMRIWSLRGSLRYQRSRPALPRGARMPVGSGWFTQEPQCLPCVHRPARAARLPGRRRTSFAPGPQSSHVGLSWAAGELGPGWCLALLTAASACPEECGLG